MASLRVRVSPRAKTDEITGWRGDVLRVRVRAAPEKGKANEAVCVLIAAELGLPARAVTVERGQTSQDKLLLVDGLGGEEIAQRLARPRDD